MGVVTVRQMQAIDRHAIEKTGIPSLVLMENAGRAVAGEVIQLVRRCPKPRVAVVCGAGNNGGDGFVAARHLLNAGIRTKIFMAGNMRNLKPDALTNYSILKKSGYLIRRVGRDESGWRRQLSNADVIVDAIFGIGLSREIREPFLNLITALNRSRARIVAVDIPSGLDGTTGKIHGICIRAVRTVTFHCAKRGFFRLDGPKYTGKIIVADIGIPQKVKGERG